MRLAPLLLALTLAPAMIACERHDIGQPCPELLEGRPPTVDGTDSTNTETQEVVEQNTKFRCDELICIATTGRDGYCSKKCREDAGCPDGFECRVIQDIGPFAGEKFCAWKRCAARKDCGPVEDFCCTSVPRADPVEDLRLCSFREDDKCP